MPKKRNPAFSKKVKKRAPVRQAFFDEYVKDDRHVLSVRFTHYENQDYLFVTVAKSFWHKLPKEFMGYPVRVKVDTKIDLDKEDSAL